MPDGGGVDGGDGSGSAQVLRYAYLMTKGGTFDVAAIDPSSGGLQLLGGVSTGQSTGHTQPLVISRDQHLLFAVNSGDNTMTGSIASFVLDPVTGWPSPAPGSPIMLPTTGADSIAIAPGGSVVYTLVQTNVSTLYAYRVDAASGRLTAIGTGIAAGNSNSVVVEPSGHFVYTTDSTANAVGAFAIQSDGTLAAGPVQSLPPDSSPSAAVVSPDGKWLVASLVGPDQIAVFAIDSATGALAPVAGSPYTVQQIPGQAAFTPDGRYLYVSNDSIGATPLDGFAVDRATGALIALPALSAVATDAIAIDPLGTFLFALGENSGNTDYKTHVYAIHADGSLTAGPTLGMESYGQVFTTGTSAVERSPRFVYVPEDEATPTAMLAGFSLDASGTMTALAGSPSLSGGLSAVVDSRGRFVYTSASDGIHAYAVAATGTLVEVAGSPYAGGGELAIDPPGQYLYALHQASDALDRFAIDPTTGALSLLNTSSSGASGVLFGLAMHPGGASMWATNNATNTVSVMPIGPAGVVYPPTMVPTGGGTSPQGVALSPDGLHAFVTLAGAGRVMSFYGVQSGSLPTTNATFAAGSLPLGLAVDPTSRFLYVADTGAAASTVGIYAFSIDPASTLLTPLSPPSFATCAEPGGLAVDPSGKVLLSACLGDGKLAAFAIAADGTLSPIGAPIQLAHPSQIAISGTSR